MKIVKPIRRSFWPFLVVAVLLSTPPRCVAAEVPESRSLSQELTVWYLGHCGFAVRVGEKLLIFDYQEEYGTASPDPEAGGLADGIIEPEDLRGLDVYVFASHSHEDHYDPRVLSWEEKVGKVTYFFGWEAGENPDHHYMIGPRETAEVGGVRVYTINSHHSGVDEVAYLVEVDGVWIYHNGDYRQDYVQDFQYLATLTDHMDLVFHGAVHEPGIQYTLQAELLLDTFGPAAFFPTHYGGKEEEMEEFARVMASRGHHEMIPLPKRRGDRWEFGGSQI